MRITVIYGTGRTELSTTYHLAKMIVDKLSDEDKVFEFFLPKDMSHFCCGCFKCFEGFHEKCPAYEMLKPIKEALNQSELIIFTVPVYVYHAPGQVKAFLDHFAWEWMVHQPNRDMFNKQALIISTAAGAGMKSAIKDVKDSMDFWGIARVYTYKKAIRAGHWNEVKNETKVKMERELFKIADKIKKNHAHLTPRLKVRFMFYGCRFMQKKFGFNEPDVKHWRENGWLDGIRPWHTSSIK